MLVWWVKGGFRIGLQRVVLEWGFEVGLGQVLCWFTDGVLLVWVGLFRVLRAG